MERFTYLFIVSIVLSFIFIAGCTQSSNRDRELINSFLEGNNKFNEIFGNIRAHPDNYTELKDDGEHLSTEARIQYDKVMNITPVSQDLTVAKENYMSALLEYEKAGIALREGAMEYTTSGNKTLTRILFNNASQSMAEGALYIANTTDSLPERFKMRTRNTTPVRTLAPRSAMKVSDNASSPLADYEFFIFDSPAQKVS